MAYDPNDAADKKIVNDLIKAAVATALEEQAEEHETELAGLKAKRTELLGKIKDLQQGKGGAEDAAEVTRLEGELATATKEVKRLTKELNTATVELGEVRASFETEKEQARNLLVDGGLTAALAANSVKPELADSVIALLKGRVEVKTNAKGEREAFVDGKPLGEFVKEWSQGDQGKHYVKAPNNGGSGAEQGQGGGQGAHQGKKLSELTEKERVALNTADPVAFKALVDADRAERNRAPAG